MRWDKDDYLEISRLCTIKEIEKEGDVLQRYLDEMAKEYLFESLRRYQKKEKELLYRNVRQGQKFSKLFSETAKADKGSVLFSMGFFAGIVRVMELLFRDLVDRRDFAHRIQGLCQKAHYLNVLKYLYRNEPARHKEIAQKEGVSRSYLTEIMKELQEAHVVDKYYQGKAAFYELTDEGKEYVKTMEVEPEKPAVDYLGKSILIENEIAGFRQEDYLEKIHTSAVVTKKKWQRDCCVPAKGIA